MLRESWKRPSLLLVGWAVILLMVFVLRGDLRVERRAPVRHDAAAATAPEPIVVRPQRTSPRQAPTIVRGGRVFDAAGFLVVGADVTIGERDLVRTDADGRFQVEFAAGQSASVTIQAPGARPVHLRMLEGGPDPLRVQLSPAAPWDVVAAPLPPLRLAGEGRVVTADGRPVAGAQVTTLAGVRGAETWARTDEAGRYVLPLVSATPTIVAYQDTPGGGPSGGLCARSEPLRLDRDRGLVPLPDLVAVEACAVRGIVRDTNGATIVGVSVRLRGNGLERQVESGTGGAFHFAGLEPGRYTLRPFAFRGAIGWPEVVTVDRPLIDCELGLRPLADRRLRLVDTEGVPVADAHVAAAFFGERTGVQRTDAQGWTRMQLGSDDLASDWTFDVRIGAEHRAAAVKRFEPQQSTLVVALH